MKLTKKILITVFTLFIFTTFFSPITTYAQAATPAYHISIQRHFTNVYNHEICVVKIDGYGQNPIAKIDGNKATLIRTDYIQRQGAVIGFLEYYDCGVLSSGTHLFSYQISPIHSPQRPSLYTSTYITI